MANGRRPSASGANLAKDRKVNKSAALLKIKVIAACFHILRFTPYPLLRLSLFGGVGIVPEGRVKKDHWDQEVGKRGDANVHEGEGHGQKRDDRRYRASFLSDGDPLGIEVQGHQPVVPGGVVPVEVEEQPQDEHIHAKEDARHPVVVVVADQRCREGDQGDEHQD